MTVDRRVVDEAKAELLSKLDYRPRAVHMSTLYQHFHDKYGDEIMTVAVTELSDEKRLIGINGWLVKQDVVEVELTKDDMDWLMGTGRFAQ